jgi:hypothetical protein
MIWALLVSQFPLSGIRGSLYHRDYKMIVTNKKPDKETYRVSILLRY